MKSSQIITFVIDKEIDIANHFIAFNSYKRNKDRGFQQYIDSFFEKLLTLNSDEEIRVEIEKYIEKFYKKGDKLESLVQDINDAWVKMERIFIDRIEEIHKFPFPYKSVKGVLSSASRFGYRNNEKENWFATDILKNKYCCIDTATHELMHFMFHYYYDKICEEKGLSKDQMWDVKESFSVLLNIGFDDIRFNTDFGYPPHQKLRKVIRDSWERENDFDKVLQDAIDFVKDNNCV